jgi:hypothetical protein
MICGNSESLTHIHFQLRKLLEVLKRRAALYLGLVVDKESNASVLAVGTISGTAKSHRKRKI